MKLVRTWFVRAIFTILTLIALCCSVAPALNAIAAGPDKQAADTITAVANAHLANVNSPSPPHPGTRTRGSNSQLALPQHLLLADVNADGLSDFLRYNDRTIFVNQTDYEQSPILRLTLNRPIKHVLTGDFHGDGNDQVCAITDDDALQCFGISTDRRELWWWFTQGSFVGANEDTIVGDFDGDCRDDVLIYSRTGGPYRMYSIKGDAFFDATPAFSQGNLEGATGKGMQVRAGDFNGDGRDDLLVANPDGQIAYYGSVFDGTNNTFWWAFTTRGGLVGRDDQITVAHIDDNGTDDVVLRNRKTGAIRFFRMEWADGVLPAITNVATGQINNKGNSLLFWGSMHGNLAEPGATYRDDALVYLVGSNMVVRSDARWDGQSLTYWWAYTQYAIKPPTPSPTPVPSPTPKPPTPLPTQRPAVSFDAASALLTGSNFEPNKTVYIRVVVHGLINGASDWREGNTQTHSDSEGRIHVNLDLGKILPLFYYNDGFYQFTWPGCFPGERVGITANDNRWDKSHNNYLWSNAAEFTC